MTTTVGAVEWAARLSTRDLTALWRGRQSVNERERTKLLFGPSSMPRLKYGERAFGLDRDQAVKVIGGDARIP